MEFSGNIPYILKAGVIIISGFYIGKSMKFVNLPSIIGFMLAGILLGPSSVNFLTHSLQENFTFITEISLGFVALSIGLELGFSLLKKQGKSILLIILFETFLTFFVVTAGIFFLTSNLPISLLLGAIASASAPMGTVAIIQEYKAKGPLTNVLYSIVGLDDGLGVLIFGFAAALAKSLLSGAKLNNFKDFIMLFYHPFLEITLSVILGLLFGVIFAYLAKKLRNPRDLFILTFGSILLLTGFCIYTNLSYIMANMLFGVFIINTQKNTLVKNLKEQLSNTMPLLFVMFFVLGGAHLELGSLLKLGMLGLIYTFTRTFGKISGCYVGAVIGKSDNIIKKYSGIGIISQAGLAIGLSLIVKHELAEISPAADAMGTTIVTVVAATCIIFEIVGPLAAKYALQKAGEIPENTI